MADYYAQLGVGRDADADTIKRAYRRLARQYHPDVNKDPGAEDRFKEIGRAYEVLSDPQVKARYDQFGEAGLGGGGGMPDMGDMGGFADLFETFFSGFGGAAAGGGLAAGVPVRAMTCAWISRSISARPCSGRRRRCSCVTWKPAAPAPVPVPRPAAVPPPAAPVPAPARCDAPPAPPLAASPRWRPVPPAMAPARPSPTPAPPARARGCSR